MPSPCGMLVKALKFWTVNGNNNISHARASQFVYCGVIMAYDVCVCI